MKIVFVNEYCHPFVPGGAEESMMQLGRALVGRGHDVTVVTPNYGAPHDEVIDGIRIERFWFPKRIVEKRRTIRGWWHTSLFWWVASSIQVARAVRRLRPDVIHIHGKFSIPAGLFTGKLFGIRTIFTARDYRAICNYGSCISEHYLSRRCTFVDYWRVEFPRYVRVYTNGSARAWVTNALFAVRGRLWSSLLLWCVRRVDRVICVSRAVARIYKANGIWQTQPIYNIQPQIAFTGSGGRHFGKNEQGEVLYIGKLSPGKGAGLLPEVIASTVARNPAIRWTLYTNGGVLERAVRNALMPLIQTGQVTISPYVPHEALLERIVAASVVFIPSVWHEPLTRLALESLQSGTPVVVTDRGGSPEIITDGITGRVVSADATSLVEAVLDVVAHEDAYRERIRGAGEQLMNTFYVQPLEAHQMLYQRLVTTASPERILGVLLPPGGSLRVLDAHGQKSRFMTYLRYYAAAFDRVFVYTFDVEHEPGLPENVILVTPPMSFGKRWYTVLMPLLHRRSLRQCQVLRVMQMDGCIPAVIARMLYGVPYVATYGYKYPEFVLLRGRRTFATFMLVIERIGVRLAHTVIYTTSELRAYLIGRCGSVVAPKLKHIPNGVDVDRFIPCGARNPHTILFVGRLEPQKNLFALLEGMALLPERQKVRLVFVGRGSLRASLEERARELGVRLEIVNRVDHLELPQYYGTARIFVLVSLIEGMPKALVEAMSAGCACLVSDCDGNRVLVQDDVNGLVVKPDATSIAVALGRLLQDSALCEKLGKSARARVLERYDLKKLLSEEVQLLCQIDHQISSRPPRYSSPKKI